METSLNQLCFSGEGKGKIRYLGENHRFSYEARLDSLNPQRPHWSLGLHIPFYGDEIIQLRWRPKAPRKATLAGNLASPQKLQSQNLKTLFKRSLGDLASFLVFYEQRQKQNIRCRPQPGEPSGTCRDAQKQALFFWTIQGSGAKRRLILRFPQSKLRIEAFDVSPNSSVQKAFFERLHLSWSWRGWRGRDFSSFAMDLYWSDCQN